MVRLVFVINTNGWNTECTGLSAGEDLVILRVWFRAKLCDPGRLRLIQIRLQIRCERLCFRMIFTGVIHLRRLNLCHTALSYTGFLRLLDLVLFLYQGPFLLTIRIRMFIGFYIIITWHIVCHALHITIYFLFIKNKRQYILNEVLRNNNDE